MSTTIESVLADPPSEPQARDLWCACCGYGAFVRDEPPECPMCRQRSWAEWPGGGRWN